LLLLQSDAISEISEVAILYVKPQKQGNEHENRKGTSWGEVGANSPGGASPGKIANWSR